MMTEDQKHAFIQWVNAWMDNETERMERANAALKATGLRAYESSQGVPFVGRWYNGPIAKGMWFTWESNGDRKPFQVSGFNENGEIRCRVYGIECLNDEERFRSYASPDA